MNWRDYIEQRPDVLMGKPVFKGTRITVEPVLERLGDGATDADLVSAYPRLHPEHIRAAQAFAAALLASDETVFTGDRISSSWPTGGSV
ncbi:MAG: DUF433 domain-containing protein [Planctomycetota bacterium]